MMNKKTVYDIDVKGKKVYVRVDYNVPHDAEGHITDDRRIRATVPTITYLLDHGAAVILASHMGRPKGEVKPELSLKPAAERLSTILGREVKFAPSCIGEEARRMKEELQPGEVLLLENLRFHKGEERNDEQFARELIEGCDAAVNDAFGVSHRSHASVVGVGHQMEMVAGLLLKKEIDFLDGVIEHPVRPFAAIIGGAKISDKIHVIANLMEKADVILIGGGMANTFVAAEGYDMGKSLQDRDRFDLANELRERAHKLGSNIMLPVDFMAGDSFSEHAKTRVLTAKEFKDPWMALDIGPRTIQLYVETLKKMKTVVWNGPMGVFEMKPFAKGTYAIANAVANLDATTVIGGGESASVVDQMGIGDKFSHVSTGGGASLEMLEGMVLPGVAVLADKGEQA
jgi:phosphoglycerate kinase